MFLQERTAVYLRRMAGQSAATGDAERRLEEAKTAPLFTPIVQQTLANKYPQHEHIHEQYALLGQRAVVFGSNYDETCEDSSSSGVEVDDDNNSDIEEVADEDEGSSPEKDEVKDEDKDSSSEKDEDMDSSSKENEEKKSSSEDDGHDGVQKTADMSLPILLNTNTPWSAFICGSQGSGKSHTLSCILENCLLQDPEITTMKQPLSAMLFNYDKHSSGRPCEAAYLASHIKTRIIVSPSNFWAMKDIYSKLNLGLQVVPLVIDPRRLKLEQVKRLMAFTTEKGESSPLYLQIVEKVLREMAFDPQSVHGFNYDLFCQKIQAQELEKAQRKYFDMRQGLLESFLHKGIIDHKGGEQMLANNSKAESMLDVQPAQLTIVDLTDPMLDPSSACSLFEICMSNYLRGDKKHGRVVALDEAHKFLTNNAGATLFTESLIQVVREQRHLGTRVIIATQEPTVSPDLLDLCSMSIVHRFSSPAWMQMLRGHLAGAFSAGSVAEQNANALFKDIVGLDVGESLLFAPSAMLDVGEDGEVVALRGERVKMKTRPRITRDGGRSVMATEVLR